MHRILLHTCCAPCATTCTERLSAAGRETVLFFSNSNIFPEEEYMKRLEHARKLALILGLELIEDTYDHASWLSHTAGLEDEPEQGARCMRCFQFSLSKTADRAGILKIPSFATTLTVSRYKPSEKIFEAGSAFPGFLPMDFKKRGGYARSIELSRLYGLYRQSYCGCEFSLRDRKRQGKP
ncbi:MAG TPA: epoxyqueuosine reductase QueH [Deltaproteobacteria bacterium]|nr:epoxyqueuosine reductase QueH [Deltaproteobacteria bacterium]HOI07135.1 epoxyqueuosine reductase QueH [Deltaproteobacteria bacterium]